MQDILNDLVLYRIICVWGPKNFSREEVLDKAMPVFWIHGFSDTSLQDLERATGVNKSGTEFRDKEDLFVACLRRSLESQEKRNFSPGSLLAGTMSRLFSSMVLLTRGNSRDVFPSTLCGSSLSFWMRLMGL
jgi:hypothetical protein